MLSIKSFIIEKNRMFNKVVSLLLFMYIIGGHAHSQQATLARYHWDIYKLSVHLLELPHDIESYSVTPSNDPGLVLNMRENKKNQLSINVIEPKANRFELVINETTPDKGVRTHTITLVLSNESLNKERIENRNRRFKTDNDIVLEMARVTKTRENQLPVVSAEGENIKVNEQAQAAAKSSYNQQIAIGDKALAAKDYDKAESAYLEAVTLQPEQTYPKNQIAQIEQIKAVMANRLAAEKQREEEQLILATRYNEAISKGDVALQNEKFDEATAAYKEALALKPNDEGTTAKIAMVQSAKVEAIEKAAIALKMAKESKRDSLSNLGDLALAQDNLEMAKAHYFAAAQMFPEATDYPKNQLRQVNLKFAEREQKLAAIKLEQDYIALMRKTDTALLNKDFEGARTLAKEALALKSDETKPQTILRNIDNPDERKRYELQADRYRSNVLVDQGAALAKNKQYTEAITLLEEAVKLWPQNNRAEFELYQAKTAMNDGVQVYPKTEIAKSTDTMAVITRRRNAPVNAAQQNENDEASDFSKAPRTQKFAPEYSDANELAINKLKADELFGFQRELSIKNDRDKIKFELDLISFGVHNAYFRINISNEGQETFALGDIMLTLVKKNEPPVAYEPTYITSFPVVQPGQKAQIIYAAKQFVPANEDKLLITLRQRVTRTPFELEIPGEVYNKEYDK